MMSRPSAASPIVPLTTTRSPGPAPRRRTILPDGTCPNAEIETMIGPGVETVSPPNSGQPYCPASSPSPRAKGVSQASSTLRNASVSRKPAGIAPLAARSDKFLRSALRATVSGGSSGRKCTPSTMASVFRTRSSRDGLRIAASSRRPNAPGSVASGLKYRAISASSPDGPAPGAIISAACPLELIGAELSRDLIEHRIHHARLIGFDKGVGDVDIFGDHYAARHVLATLQFVSTGAQHRAQDGIDPLQRPTSRQRLVDQGIEFRLIAHHARDDVAEEGGFRRQIFFPFDLAAEPVAFEFGENVVDARAGNVHLVERLHGGKPRGAAPVGFPFRALSCRFLVFGHDQARVRVRLIRNIAIAARAASPPLSSSLALARAHACASVLTVMMPLPSGTPLATARSIKPREDSIDTISKWMVSPLMTQPRATTRSNGLPWLSPASRAIAIAAGISSAPGTVITSCVTPAALSSATAPSSSAS